MELGIGSLIVVVAITLTLGRMVLKRNQWVEDKPKAKQHKKIQEFEPEHTTPSIEDLIEEEAADLGLNDIPGGEGIETSVKLRVWHRDGSVRSGCAGGTLRYEIDDGVEPADAELGQVHLSCTKSGQSANEPQQSAASQPADPRDTIESDTHSVGE